MSSDCDVLLLSIAGPLVQKQEHMQLQRYHQKGVVLFGCLEQRRLPSAALRYVYNLSLHQDCDDLYIPSPAPHQHQHCRVLWLLLPEGSGWCGILVFQLSCAVM